MDMSALCTARPKSEQQFAFIFKDQAGHKPSCCTIKCKRFLSAVENMRVLNRLSIFGAFAWIPKLWLGRKGRSRDRIRAHTTLIRP